MPELKMSHLEFCAVFAFLTSVVLGVVSKNTDRKRVSYALRSFAHFMIAVFALGWLMYLRHG